MKQFLVYLFWPNPGNTHYDNPKVVALLVLCGVLLLAAFALSLWRRRTRSGMLRRLSRSWGVACFWFGVTGLVLTVARVENIQYLAMRFLWVLWLVLAVLFLVVQVRFFRMRYYEVVPQRRKEDERERYLPGKGRKG